MGTILKITSVIKIDTDIRGGGQGDTQPPLPSPFLPTSLPLKLSFHPP